MVRELLTRCCPVGRDELAIKCPGPTRGSAAARLFSSQLGSAQILGLLLLGYQMVGLSLGSAAAPRQRLQT
jgi:hypothetical protein